MRRILLGIFVLLVAAVTGFAVYVAMLPEDYRVARSTTIHAPASVVYPHFNNFRKFNEWSPWAKLDPNAKNTFEGPDEGVGAFFKWAGNNNVGEGSMKIVESTPNERILIDLQFTKPNESRCDTEFTFKEEGDKTKVTWSMSGKNGFVGRAMFILMNINLEKMVGEKYEEGLASVKGIVEKSGKQ